MREAAGIFPSIPRLSTKWTQIAESALKSLHELRVDRYCDKRNPLLRQSLGGASTHEWSHRHSSQRLERRPTNKSDRATVDNPRFRATMPGREWGNKTAYRRSSHVSKLGRASFAPSFGLCRISFTDRLCGALGSLNADYCQIARRPRKNW